MSGKTITQEFGTYFEGTFDGRGYTISNLTLSSRIWRYSACGTFKNVAFLNTNQTLSAGGLLFGEQYNPNMTERLVTIENVYVHYSNYKNDGNVGALVQGFAKAGVNNSIKNVVIVIDNVLADITKPVVAFSGPANLSDVYVVSSNATKLLASSTDSTGIYTSQSAFDTVVAGWTNTSDSIGAFSKDLWTINNGKLVMKSMLS